MRTFMQRQMALAVGVGAIALLVGPTRAPGGSPPVTCPTGMPLVVRISIDGVGNDIPLDSWAWGETQGGTPQAGGGVTGQRLDAQDIHFTKVLDVASPKLFLGCASSQHIASATLDICADPACSLKYMSYQMEDGLVASYSTGGSAGSDCLPTEQITLSFAKITVAYQQQNQSGTLQRKGKRWSLAPGPTS